MPPALLANSTVRRCCQIFLIAIFAGLALFALWVDLVVIRKAQGALAQPQFATSVFRLFNKPVQDTFAPVIVIATSVLPMLFTSVCYVIKPNTEPPESTGALNRVGTIVFWLTMAGVFVGALSFVVFGLNANAVATLAGGPDKQGMLGLISTLTSFYAIYFCQFLGLKPK